LVKKRIFLFSEVEGFVRRRRFCQTEEVLTKEEGFLAEQGLVRRRRLFK